MCFSFIMPARNEEGAIDLCIQSILRQDYSGLVQIIVINDHSTDNTADIAKQLGATVLTPDMPLGKTTRAYNKNLAVKSAKGDYIIFMDAHIILPSNKWLSDVAALITKNSTSDPFLASFPAIPPPELVILLNFLPQEDVKTIALSLANVKGPNQFIGGSMVISKELFLKIGGFPLIPVSEDIALYQNCIKHGTNYKFVQELWVWHIDKKLMSIKLWLKRSTTEGFRSTAYRRENDSIRVKFGHFYSFLLLISIVFIWFNSFFAYLFLSLLTMILLLQSSVSIRAMKASNGKMSVFRMVLPLILIQFTQVFIIRASAAAGMIVFPFIRIKYRWLKRVPKRKSLC